MDTKKHEFLSLFRENSCFFVAHFCFCAKLIFGLLLLNDKNGLLLGVSKEPASLSINLLILIRIPVGLGFFLGIGLFLFGVARMIYALFEQADSKINPALIERLIVALILALLLAVAVPNLIFNYREARRSKQSPPIPVSAINLRQEKLT